MRRLSFLLVLVLVACLCSCGGGSSSTKPPAIGVSLTPATSLTIVQGQQKSVSVTVSNDSKSLGVTWALGGTGCTGAACGTLTNATATSVMYNAPASVTSNMTVSVTATSVADTTKSASVSITVAPVPSITTTSLPNGVQNATYTATTLAATGGIPPLTWSVTVGSLPAGLTLNSATGVISGKPTTALSSSFTVQVSDSSSPALTATKALSIDVDPPPPLSITTSSLPNGVQNTAYTSTTLAATGGTLPYTAWSITVGTLPAGLTLNSSTGVISGTPTAAGTSDFTVKVTDSTTPALNASKALRIVIAPPQLTITTATLPGGTMNSTYVGATLAAIGGTPPIAWTVTGNFPAGLTLHSATGVIDGTPTAAGTFDFAVTATDSATTPQTKTQALSIVVTPALSITTASLPDGALNTAYNFTLASSGGTAPVTWSVVGALPAGLTLNANTGVISGTPTTAGKADFTVQAADHSTPPATPQKALSITVVAAPLVINTTTLPGGVANSAYSATTLQATGGTPPIAWTVTGNFPAGLTLHTATGVIDGTPTANGTFDFTVTATDSSVTPQVKTKPLSIAVTPALSITTSSLPDGAVNTAYTFTLASTGGTPSVTWSTSAGSLPAGLNLNASSGVISGTPTAAGKVDFSIKATDHSTPPQTPEVSLSITIAAAPFVITTTTLNNATIGTAYSQTLNATGGTPPITWTATGSLPSGLTLHSSTGVIDGTPSGSPTITTFSVTGTDSGSPVQSKTQSLSITTTLGGTNNAELSGHYAYSLRGFDSLSGNGYITRAGSFNANGSGLITGGVEDYNSTTTVHSNQAITNGFYSIGSDHRGTMTLVTGQGTFTYSFVLGNISSGVSQGGRMIETDTAVLTGQFKKQDTSAFSTASITGNFAFQVGGVQSTGKFATVGVMAFNGNGACTVTMDSNNSGTVFADTSTGTYVVADTVNGRGLYTDTGSTHIPFYVVSANEAILINIDAYNSGGQPIFSGSAQKQSGSFSNASLNGKVVFMSESAAEYSGGKPSKVYTGLGLFTMNGAGGITAAEMDENDGGTISHNTGMTGTYTVASNGRVTWTMGGSPMASVFYLIGAGKAFIMGTNGAVAEGMLKPQTNGTFSNASMSGNYIYGPEAPVLYIADLDLGLFTSDGAGHITGTTEKTQGGSGSVTKPIVDTYSIASNGRGTSTNKVIYIISSSKAMMINVSPGTTDSSIYTIDQQ